MTSTAESTGSTGSRRFGIITLVAVAILLFLALVATPPEVTQGESVRLFYIHVPSVVTAFYVGYALCAVGSAMYLWRRSQVWDLVAWASAEVGSVFCAIGLITGSLWGRATWGTFWEWDPRLTSTAISFVLYLGYLAVRRMDLDPHVRAQRAAVIGLVSFFNVFIVRFSVQWWRSLHQQQTFGVDTQMDDLMLFTAAFGMLTAVMVFGWLTLQRFRVLYLEQQIRGVALDEAVAARQREAVGLEGA